MSEPRNVTVDRALQTIGGILLTITVAISGWTLLQVINHEGRIIRVEANADNTVKTTEELKTSVKELNGKMDRMLELMVRKP